MLAGRAAGFLYRLSRRVKAPPAPEVIAPRARRVDGIDVSRACRIDRLEVTTFKRIPITTPARTLVDHSSRHAWEQDHRREREASARGDDFRRYTWDDVFEDPRPLLAELRPVIGSPPPS